ncbi:TetR/AcrR family transcriptional regulator [uncultured Erythrobacter sp.]|uniref:TetR/AcrR family transcriptional regulator n=1 Tax=uncultured Erythrobacter sp. TaxID=263913 RepID=UPI002606ABC8|nr:TetR/AcrR family transcriptional regulator [uncultured Erythrobacter sp.]
MSKNALHKLEATPMERPLGRSERVGKAVAKATLELLRETGYADITFEKIADRAGVNRATLYRRWQSKPRLVASAMLEFMHVNAPTPNTGSVQTDLVELMTELSDFMETPLSASFMQVMGVEARKDPEVGEAVRDFWEQRFEFTREILKRGIERKELTPIDNLDGLIDQTFGPFYLLSLRTGAGPSKTEVEQLVDRALAPHLC